MRTVVLCGVSYVRVSMQKIEEMKPETQTTKRHPRYKWDDSITYKRAFATNVDSTGVNQNEEPAVRDEKDSAKHPLYRNEEQRRGVDKKDGGFSHDSQDCEYARRENQDADRGREREEVKQTKNSGRRVGRVQAGWNPNYERRRKEDSSRNLTATQASGNFPVSNSALPEKDNSNPRKASKLKNSRQQRKSSEEIDQLVLEDDASYQSSSKHDRRNIHTNFGRQGKLMKSPQENSNAECSQRDYNESSFNESKQSCHANYKPQVFEGKRPSVNYNANPKNQQSWNASNSEEYAIYHSSSEYDKRSHPPNFGKNSKQVNPAQGNFDAEYLHRYYNETSPNGGNRSYQNSYNSPMSHQQINQQIPEEDARNLSSSTYDRRGHSAKFGQNTNLMRPVENNFDEVNREHGSKQYFQNSCNSPLLEEKRSSINHETTFNSPDMYQHIYNKQREFPQQIDQQMTEEDARHLGSSNYVRSHSANLDEHSKQVKPEQANFNAEYSHRGYNESCLQGGKQSFHRFEKTSNNQDMSQRTWNASNPTSHNEQGEFRQQIVQQMPEEDARHLGSSHYDRSRSANLDKNSKQVKPQQTNFNAEYSHRGNNESCLQGRKQSFPRFEKTSNNQDMSQHTWISSNPIKNSTSYNKQGEFCQQSVQQMPKEDARHLGSSNYDGRHSANLDKNIKQVKPEQANFNAEFSHRGYKDSFLQGEKQPFNRFEKNSNNPDMSQHTWNASNPVKSSTSYNKQGEFRQHIVSLMPEKDARHLSSNYDGSHSENLDENTKQVNPELANVNAEYSHRGYNDSCLRGGKQPFHRFEKASNNQDMYQNSSNASNPVKNSTFYNQQIEFRQQVDQQMPEENARHLGSSDYDRGHSGNLGKNSKQVKPEQTNFNAVYSRRGFNEYYNNGGKPSFRDNYISPVFGEARSSVNYEKTSNSQDKYQNTWDESTSVKKSVSDNKQRQFRQQSDQQVLEEDAWHLSSSKYDRRWLPTEVDKNSKLVKPLQKNFDEVNLNREYNERQQPFEDSSYNSSVVEEQPSSFNLEEATASQDISQQSVNASNSEESSTSDRLYLAQNAVNESLVLREKERSSQGKPVGTNADHSIYSTNNNTEEEENELTDRSSTSSISVPQIISWADACDSPPQSDYEDGADGSTIWNSVGSSENLEPQKQPSQEILDSAYNKLEILCKDLERNNVADKYDLQRWLKMAPFSRKGTSSTRTDNEQIFAEIYNRNRADSSTLEKFNSLPDSKAKIDKQQISVENNTRNYNRADSSAPEKINSRPTSEKTHSEVKDSQSWRSRPESRDSQNSYGQNLSVGSGRTRPLDLKGERVSGSNIDRPYKSQLYSANSGARDGWGRISQGTEITNSSGDYSRINRSLKPLPDIVNVKMESMKKKEWITERKEPRIIMQDSKVLISSEPSGKSWISYERDFLTREHADSSFFEFKKAIPWEQKECIIKGESFLMPRLMAWYGPMAYSFCGATLNPCEGDQTTGQPWPPLMEFIHNQLRTKLNCTFNSCLLNYYRDENDSVAWHSDNEGLMGVHPLIASVSLGAERLFELRKNPTQGEDEDKTDQVRVYLTHGSLVVTSGALQDDWKHRVGKHNKPCGERINLTFRNVYPNEDRKKNFSRSDGLWRNHR